MSTTQDLNISLEPHLRKALTELPSVLPIELLDELASYLNRPEGPSNTIPYGVLHKVSLWSRTSSGQDALQNCTPPLDPRSYSMVALLAGTRTSPEKKFPAYAAKDPEAERRRAADDRKAVSTVINAVLSVAGTGFATWWASERTGLRVEWRALLAVSAALLVALAEIILYVIWDSRRNATTQKPKQRASPVVAETKRDSDEGDDVVSAALTSSTRHEASLLRQRVGASAVSPGESL